VRNLDELRLVPRAVEAAARLSQAGFVVAIATNQDFVGHGYITRADHDAVMQHIVDEVAKAGGRVERVYACLHPKTEDCDDRKPKPGMLLQAARELDLDLSQSIMVGDNRKDMLAGRRAGCRTVLLDPRFRTRWQRAEAHADVVASSLDAAVPWILGQRVVRLTPSVPVPVGDAPSAPAPGAERRLP
jgi:D-glycero-D-manno-heptose 1,7-bisphosphate phosphatase